VGTADAGEKGVIITGGITINNVGQLNHFDQTWTVSDRRLKENLSPIQNALEKVSQISGIYYDWKHTPNLNIHGDQEHAVGVFAQDVGEVLPEATDSDVFRNNSHTEKYMGVRYNDLIPLLIEALHDIEKNIDEAMTKRQLDDCRQQQQSIHDEMKHTKETEEFSESDRNEKKKESFSSGLFAAELEVFEMEIKEVAQDLREEMALQKKLRKEMTVLKEELQESKARIKAHGKEKDYPLKEAIEEEQKFMKHSNTNEGGEDLEVQENKKKNKRKCQMPK